MEITRSDKAVKIRFKFPLDDAAQLYYYFKWYSSSPEILVTQVTLVCADGAGYRTYNDFSFIKDATLFHFENLIYSHLIRKNKVQETKIAYTGGELDLWLEIAYTGGVPSLPAPFDRKAFLEYLHREIDDRYGRS